MFIKKLFNSTKKLVFAGVLLFISLFFIAFSDDEFKITKSLDIYMNVFKELNLLYVDKIDPEALIKKSIDAMLESLDPYTTFIPESEMEDFKFMTSGQYGGVGALIRKIGDYAQITDPYEGFPAAKTGLRAGDLIHEINDISIKGKDISQISEMLKGTPNTEVLITIERPGESKLRKFTVLREKITIPNVPYYGMVNDSVGYIRLSNFTNDAGKEVKAALTDLKNNWSAKAVILDLRGNPGGLLIEAVNVTNVFVEKGQEIVSTRGKVKKLENVYKTQYNTTDLIIPLAVLVNSSSASASEIVSGAIQDLDRGVIIGQRTYGKGLVQTTRPLTYNTQLKVTTAKYYIPSGRCIQAVDYSHRNEDGSVGNIPDSLIKEFKTKTGRSVFDGGGINPDIITNVETFSNLTTNLYSKNIIFDFATNYAFRHETIESPEKFKINDAFYNEFTGYVKNQKFEYESQSDKTLDELVENLKKENYYNQSENEIKALKNALSHDIEKDMSTFRNEITRLLKEEVCSRYYYQKGRIQCELQDDEEIRKALELFHHMNEYKNILSKNYNNGAIKHENK